MIVGSGVFFFVALVWMLLPVSRALWHVLIHPHPDRPAALVEVAAQHLGRTRPEWAQAMLAEIHHIQGTTHRWRFAIDCGLVAIWPPGASSRADRALRAVVVAGAAGCILVALYATSRPANLGIDMDAKKWMALTLVLVIYALVVFVMSRLTSIRLTDAVLCMRAHPATSTAPTTTIVNVVRICMRPPCCGAQRAGRVQSFCQRRVIY